MKHTVFTKITNGVVHCQNEDLAATCRPSKFPETQTLLLVDSVLQAEHTTSVSRSWLDSVE